MQVTLKGDFTRNQARNQRAKQQWGKEKAGETQKAIKQLEAERVGAPTDRAWAAKEGMVPLTKMGKLKKKRF